MKIKSMLLGSNGIIVGVFVIVSVVIGYSISSLITNSDWVTHTNKVIGTANKLVAYMVDQETGVRGYMATGDEAFLEPYHGGKENFSELIVEAKELVSDNPKQVERFAEVERLAGEWDSKVVALYFATRESVTEGKAVHAALMNFLASGVGKSKMDAFRASWKATYDAAFTTVGVDACWGLLLDMVNMETGMRGFLATGRESYLEPFNEGLLNINKRFEVMEAADLPGVSELKVKAFDWINSAGKKSVELKREALKYQDIDAIVELMGQKLGKQYMDTLRAKISAIVEEEEQLLVKRQTAAEETAAWAKWVTIFGVAIAVILAIVIALYILRTIMAQLGKEPRDLAAVAKRVTSGDFDIDDGSAKVGVYGDIVTMVGTLKEKISQAQAAEKQAGESLKSANEAMEAAERGKAEIEQQTQVMLNVANQANEIADRVASAAEQLAAQVEQVSRSADIQQQRVGETATSMEEMNSTVVEVARNASEATNQSHNARDKADEGASLVHSVVVSIKEVENIANSLQSNMGQLGEQAEAIGSIMTVITDIADQTNLLALNAAIEAARAGEAGRGFAVVADEVRKLAEKTMAATNEVGNSIKAIQASAETNVDSVNSAVKSVTEATSLANNSGATLSDIVAMSNETAGLISSIATAAEQQSATSEEINRAIGDVNRIVSETSEGMTQSSNAVQELAEMAEELKAVLQRLQSN